MFKEFPYYDRCKPIFLNESSPATPPVTTTTEVAVHSETRANPSSVPLTATMMKPEPSHLTNEPSSPTLDLQTTTNKRISSSPPFAALKKKKVSRATTSTTTTGNDYYVNHNMNNR